MELRDYAQAVRRRWWLVVGAVVLGLAAGMGATALTQPVYQSSVGFFVVAPTADRLSALEADNLVRGRITSYAILVTSESFLNQVVAATGQDLTVAQAASRISASADPSTLILSVKVRDTDAQRSLAMATAVANNFAKTVNDLEGKAAKAQADTVLNVVSGPTLAPSPVSPRRSLNLGLGLLLGLAVGLALVLGLERGDRSLRSAKKLAEATDAQVLATLPQDKAAHTPATLMAPGTNAALMEAVRGLRTNLSFHAGLQELRLVAVAGPHSGAGTTLTAMTLAKVFSETGRRVLLLEANLRRPALAATLELPAVPGLTEVLAGEQSLHASIQRGASGALDVLVAGQTTDRPSELLASGMQGVLQQVQALYDVVIVDTAAVTPWTDAAIVAASVDGTVLVVRHGKTTPDDVTEALASLAAVGAPVLGTVLNAAPGRRARSTVTTGKAPVSAVAEPPAPARSRHTRPDAGDATDPAPDATAPDATVPKATDRVPPGPERG